MKYRNNKCLDYFNITIHNSVGNEKLKRDKHVFECSKCKVKMDRDINATMNCYRSFYEPDKYEFSDT